MHSLNSEIEKINLIGKTAAKKLKKLSLYKIKDLLYYFPFRYEEYAGVQSFQAIKLNSNVNIKGRIEFIQNKRSFKKRMYITEAIVSANAIPVKVVWFNQPFIAKNLKVGDYISLAGKLEKDFAGFIIKSPAYEKITSFAKSSLHTEGLVPIYPLTSNLTQKQIRYLISQAIKLVAGLIDWLPKQTIKKLKLLSLGDAIKKIHFPKSQNDIIKARERLAFDELFLLQIQSQILKNNLKNATAEKINFKENETKKFINSLPFSLTDSQKRSSWAILQDMQKDKPMSRLLEGDVGSGKTLVAIIALLNCALNERQGILMVPTEILAFQHFKNIANTLKEFKFKIGIITNSRAEANFKLEGKNKKEIISKNCQIIIGTHSLIQEKINFKNLALAIIDEQHRFGVEQRKILTKKGDNPNFTPHFLSMTATPIPRSLALALYGDLDISIIDEMPKNRKKIFTKIVSEEKRDKAYDFIKQQINFGRQIFVVCPLIDVSDKLGVKSVLEEFEKLNKSIFPELNIHYLHGKMKPDEKETIMEKFLKNEINILVATSVIEVGIDIPNATIMMVEGAERFGLAQLHQFRGRIGRGEHQSYCFLFADYKSQKTHERLLAMEKFNDGFSLSKIDLELRGPGEVFGTMQKGFPELKIASLFDVALIKKAKEEALALLQEDPELKNYFYLKTKINELNQNVHLE